MTEEAEQVHAPPGRPCYRCNEFVRMTVEASAHWPNTWTICPVCRVKLDTEAGFVGAAIPVSQPEPKTK